MCLRRSPDCAGWIDDETDRCVECKRPFPHFPEAGSRAPALYLCPCQGYKLRVGDVCPVCGQLLVCATWACEDTTEPEPAPPFIPPAPRRGPCDPPPSKPPAVGIGQDTKTEVITMRATKAALTNSEKGVAVLEPERPWTPFRTFQAWGDDLEDALRQPMVDPRTSSSTPRPTQGFIEGADLVSLLRGGA